VNTVLFGITLPDDNLGITLPGDEFIFHELFQSSARPYLEANWLRPRLLAIQKTRPIAYRAKLLGRALVAERTNSSVNFFWMLLSGNAEVVFPSTTPTTTPAANVPTPATVDASGNAASVVATPIAIDASAANGTAPASGQKRKTSAVLSE
jgi:hypothetical protein